MNVATLSAKITLDDREYQAGLKRSEKALYKFSDQISAAAAHVRDLGRQGQGTGSGLGNVFSTITSGARAVGSAFLSLGRIGGAALNGLLGIAGNLVGVIGSLVSSVFSLASAVGGALTNAFRTVLSVATRVGAVFGGVIAAGFALVAKAGVDMNLTLEGARTALTQLIGSAPRAGLFLKALEREAASSIPTLKDLLPIATQLVQAYGPQGLAKVLPTIRAFGDAASIAAGGDTNRMNLALLGFRQILNRGQAQQEELNQIGENLGVNVTGILKRRFGTADTELLKKARVTGEQVADAIVAGLTAQFGGAQSRMARAIPGMLSNLQDAFNAGAGRVTQGLTRSIQRGLEMALRQAQRLLGNERFIRGLSAPFELLGKAIEGAAARLPGLVTQIENFVGGGGLARIGSQAEAAFGTLMSAAQMAFNFIRDNWKEVWDGAKKVFTDTIRIVMSTYLTFSRLFGSAIEATGATWEGVWEGIKTVTTNTIKLIGGGIAGVIEVFKELGKVQEDGQTGWQNLGVAIKKFTLDSIASVTVLAARVLGLVGAAAQLLAVFRLLSGDPLGALGATAMAVGAYTLGYNTMAMGAGAFNFIKNLDTSKMAGAMGKMTGAGGLPGAFSEGFNRFGTEFDARMAAPLPGFAPAPFAPAPAAAPNPAFPGAPSMGNAGGGMWLPNGNIQAPWPAGGTGAGGGNPFAPVMGPNGQLIPAWMANGAQGPVNPTVAAGAAMVGGKAAGAANVNVSVDVRSLPIDQMLDNNPRFREALGAFVRWFIESEQNR